MILRALAVWRLTSLLVYENGPVNVFVHLRETFSGPLECFWCASVWTAGFFALFTKNKLFGKIVLWLALSAMAIFVDEARMKFLGVEEA